MFTLIVDFDFGGRHVEQSAGRRQVEVNAEVSHKEEGSKRHSSKRYFRYREISIFRHQDD